MRYVISLVVFGIVSTGAFLYVQPPEKTIAPVENPDTNIETASTPPKEEKIVDPNADIENQLPLANPPAVIKAVYLTSWSAGTEKKIQYLLTLASSTEINAVVIDIKDYSGYIAYDAQIPEALHYKSKETRIRKPNALIKRLHDAGIYLIARVTVFQDPVLAAARPDLAIHTSSTGGIWYDKKNLAWLDPAGKETWDYVVAIAKDAAARGFDEINFDYIRFPSDGDLDDTDYPFWDERTAKHETIRTFFKYLRQSLPNTKISADIFGIATIRKDDLGIGQIIEDAYEYFDYVAPMVYPSHYGAGILGYKNPAEHPYEIVLHALQSALKRSTDYSLQTTASSPATSSSELQAISYKPKAALRPWLQDFSLTTKYNKDMVRAQIKAVSDAGGESGWMLWNPSNVYTREALQLR